MPRPCQVLRVFTRGDIGGNLLGVVNDLVDLDSVSMQQIATDLGFSETVFVDWRPNEVPYVRIFTPAMELPFAGHPLVGSAWVMTRLAPGAGVDRLRCKAGEIAIAVESETTWIEAALGQRVSAVSDETVVERTDLPRPMTAAWVEMPLAYLMLEYASVDEVVALQPDMEVLAGHFGTMAFSRNEDSIRARFFAPAGGVPEDPATGSAAIALAALSVDRGEHSGRAHVLQGEEVGMPSRIELSWTSETASIGGTVVRDEAVPLD